MECMGRATESKTEQLLYLKNRIRLISEMTSGLDDGAGSADLENLNQQIKALTIKIQRFKQDWETEETR